MDLKSNVGRIHVQQLSFKLLLEPTGGLRAILDESTTEQVVLLMAEAITAVFQQREVHSDDPSCPKP